MTDILSGIRAVELAAWTFVSAAGAVLADWGLRPSQRRCAVTAQRLGEAEVS